MMTRWLDANCDFCLERNTVAKARSVQYAYETFSAAARANGKGLTKTKTSARLDDSLICSTALKIASGGVSMMPFTRPCASLMKDVKNRPKRVVQHARRTNLHMKIAGPPIALMWCPIACRSPECL